MKKLIIIILFIVLSGCSIPLNKSAYKSTKKTDDLKQTVGLNGKLKVAYWNSDQFMKDYGNLFKSKYPNVDFEVIPLPLLSQTKDYETTFKKMIEDNDIDLIYTRGFTSYLAKNNVLYDLDPLIKRDKFDLSKIYPPVIERIEQMGDNKKLYGLSTTFLMNALYYNKDLFDQYAIPYPKDYMTWYDVIQLAKKFNTSSANKIIGLSIADPSPYQLVKNIGKSEGLSEFDSSGKFHISSNEWIAIWDFVAEQIRSHNIVLEGREIGSDSKIQYDAFLKGLSAMTISNSVMVRELFKAGNSFNWALVTEPVNKNNPTESDSIYVSDIFSINANSDNVDLAWEFLKFINSDEGTSLLQKQDNYALTSHTPLLNELQGHDLSSFYKLQLKKTLPESIPPSFYAQLDAPSETEITAVITGEKATTDVVKSLETKGNEILKTISTK